MLCQDVMACCLSIPDGAQGACFLWLWRTHCTLQLYYSVVLQTEYLGNELCLVSDYSTTPDSMTALPKLRVLVWIPYLSWLIPFVIISFLITEMTLTYKGKEESSGLSTAQMLLLSRVQILFFKPPQKYEMIVSSAEVCKFRTKFYFLQKEKLVKTMFFEDSSRVCQFN